MSKKLVSVMHFIVVKMMTTLFCFFSISGNCQVFADHSATGDVSKQYKRFPCFEIISHVPVIFTRKIYCTEYTEGCPGAAFYNKNQMVIEIQSTK